MKTVLYPTSRKTFKSQLDQRAARIVIIDDKGSIRSSVRLALQLQEIVKFRFYEASNITDGRALISQIHPELVILDLNMPGGDGFQLVDELRSDPQLRGTHILMMTSENSLGNLFRLEDKTVPSRPLYSFLGKPFNIEELQAFVYAHLFRFPKPKFRLS